LLIIHILAILLIISILAILLIINILAILPKNYTRFLLKTFFYCLDCRYLV
jgi:hypothetical protein